MWMWDDNERTARWRATHAVKWRSPLSLNESQAQALPFAHAKHLRDVKNSTNSLYHFAAAVNNKLIKALILMCTIPNVGWVAQSVYRLTWTFRDRIPVGTRFPARPDRLWGPPSLL